MRRDGMEPLRGTWMTAWGPVVHYLDSIDLPPELIRQLRAAVMPRTGPAVAISEEMNGGG